MSYSLNDIYVSQLGVFEKNYARCGVCVDTSPAKASEHFRGLHERPGTSIVLRTKPLSAFHEVDRERIYRLFDKSGDIDWSNFNQNPAFDSIFEQQLCSNDFKAVEDIRSMFFTTDGAILLQNKSDMTDSFNRWLDHKKALEFKHTYVKKSDRDKFEAERRKFENDSLSMYSDEGECLTPSADSYEAAGFDDPGID